MKLEAEKIRMQEEHLEMEMARLDVERVREDERIMRLPLEDMDELTRSFYIDLKNEIISRRRNKK